MGEKMNEKELNHCLSTLLGEEVTIDSLEDQFSSQSFAENLLGFAPEGGAQENPQQEEGEQ